MDEQSGQLVRETRTSVAAAHPRRVDYARLPSLTSRVTKPRCHRRNSCRMLFRQWRTGSDERAIESAVDEVGEAQDKDLKIKRPTAIHRDAGRGVWTESFRHWLNTRGRA